MTERFIRILLCLALLVVGRSSLANESKSKSPSPNLAEFQSDVRPILMRACVDCHGEDAQEGNVRIDTLDPDLVHGEDVDWWLEVLGVLNNGEMPPADAAEISDDDRSRVVLWLSNEIQLASKLRRESADRSSFRRLTRYETNHALQDLLGLDYDFAKDLPPESHSEDGFQNSSAMLHMSVTQLETYRQLARDALTRATVRGERPPVIRWGISMKEAAAREWAKRDQQVEELKKKFASNPSKQKQEVEQFLAGERETKNRPHYRNLINDDIARAQWKYNGARYAFAPSDAPPSMPETFDHVAVIPAGGNQNLIVELGDTVPNEGMMRVRARASKVSDNARHIPNLRLEFGFQASNEGKAEVNVSQRDTPITATSDAPAIYEWDVPLGEIYPRNSFRGLAKMGGLPSPSEYIRFVNTSVPSGRHGSIQLDWVEVSAPVHDVWPPASHTRIFFDSDNRDDETEYAHEILESFMTRSWRRAIEPAEIQRKLQLFDAIRPQCETFVEAMVEVLATVLSSPNFLYVNESESDSSALSGYELATRLSLFLWCSVPDEELLQLAGDGRLFNPVVLSEQVDRMLADSRSNRFTEKFVHQWLDMQLFDFQAAPKKSSPDLRDAMRREPIEFFAEVLRTNASVLDFIDSDYTIVNERLAVFYGLPGVRGNEFRRVLLDRGDAAKQRGGLLTQAALLAMNSDGVDSHPLKRGVWLLESILNDPPPPAPPAVPEIDLADPAIAKMTLKERIEDHRNHAACMSCHIKIDPWGIAFEHYDALGRYRDKINGKPVDASSKLFNKEELNGVDGLKEFLLSQRQDQFVGAMVYKLAAYGLGRPLVFGDRASLNAITADVRKRGDGLATMIRQFVLSDLFQSK